MNEITEEYKEQLRKNLNHIKFYEMNLPGLVEEGRFNGYPECCIIEFGKRMIFLKGIQYGMTNEERSIIMSFTEDAAMTDDHIKIAGDTEFIPCKKHVEELIKSGKDISTLITDRKCPTPFPIGKDDE